MTAKGDKTKQKQQSTKQGKASKSTTTKTEASESKKSKQKLVRVRRSAYKRTEVGKNIKQEELSKGKISKESNPFVMKRYCCVKSVPLTRSEEEGEEDDDDDPFTISESMEVVNLFA